ncbi:MAG: SIS domain-containing protein [Planctomycetota bacterium]
MSPTHPAAAALAEAQRVLDELVASGEGARFTETLGEWLSLSLSKGGRVLAAGNGGSHADALHFAEEFTGKYRKERRPLAVMALGEATHATCTANDFGFEDIFARQVEAFARSGDVLVLLSTSGNSENLIRAASAAKKSGAKVVGLLGKGGGKLKPHCDLSIVVPGSTADRIQELHMLLLHTAIEMTERRMFPEHY